MAKESLSEEMEFPEGVNASLDGVTLIVSGVKGEVNRTFRNPRVILKIDGRKIILSTVGNTRRDKTILKTYIAHIENAFHGVKEGYVYKLKICSGHFPMTVSMSNNILEIKNFLGEKIPRKVKLKSGAKVKVEGDRITVEGQDKERTGQVAADIEQATRRPGFDRRIFQDGIYITDKAGELI
ncbi:MAG: 50S ribosomal protein L6 [Nanoarchaeota archaeon]